MAVRYGNYKAHYVTRSGWGYDPPEVLEQSDSIPEYVEVETEQR